jgi:hypothetical protein
VLPNFRELSTRSKILAVGCSAFLVAGLATATVASSGVSVSGALPPSSTGAGDSMSRSPAPADAGSAAPRLLPGAKIWDRLVSSDIFGTNDAIEYSSPNVDTLPSVQADLKAGGLTLMRTWAYADYSDADIEQRIATIQNSGMQCMMMLGSTGDLSWMEHVVSMLGSNCNIYEFGNEPDNANNGTNIAQTTKRWIDDIPLLRAINPHAVFGGPAVQYAESSDGTQGSYASDIAYFLAKTAAAGVRADFVSYHDYPCEKATSTTQCLSMTSGDFKYNYDLVISWENQYYGSAVPTGISEYNFDPGTNNLYAWGDDNTFMKEWTDEALNALVKVGAAFANQFTSLNYSGYGYLDMFHDAAPYGPKAQYRAMAAFIAKYDGPSTVAVPNSLPS